MAAMTMDREPEVARFIDTYKFDQEMSTRRDRFGGGTSLPLHSDGYEDKQRSLRDERHRDWLGQQEKQKQLEQQKIEARRRSPPRPAQPQGPQIDYNLAGQQAKAEEKRAYQDYMGKYQYTANAPPKPTFDYEENKKVLNEERKREYNQLMEKKAKEEQYWQMRGRPVTPPGGLNIGNYDRQLKETAAAKKKEYKEMLDQQKFEQQKLRAMDRVADLSPKYVSYRESERPLVGSPRDVNYYMQEKFEKDKFRKDLRNSPQRDFSPPGKNQVAEQSSMMEDANFKAFMEVEKDKAMNKRKYAEELLQQQKEHMYLRARQEPEMAVIDRNAPPQHLANKPPAGPGYNRSRDEPLRQNPAYWNEGRQAHGPRSFDSDVSRRSSGIPAEFKNDSKSRAIPDRERYGQPPFPGEGHSKAERENKNKDIPERKSPVRSPRSPPKSPLRSPPKSPLRSPPKSPLKSPSRRYMSERRRVSDAEHAVEGTPLAFKTESRPIPERPQYGQPPYPGHGQYVPEGEMLNPDAIERPPVGPQPRALEKLSPVWLKPQDDDRPVEGTPLAFKTNSYSRQPPPAPEQAFNGPPAFSNNGQRPIENGMDGFYERPVRTPGRPRSRRSVESERKYAPTNVDSGAQISPRRMKNTFYEDSQEVSSKRIEASKERQKDYNDFIRLKNEEKRRYEEEKHHQQISKPAEVVKNQYYSSDDYEKFQKEIQRKQGEEYRDFLAKQKVKHPDRRHEFVDTASGPYGGLFQGLGDHGNRSEALNKERQREYNEQHAGKEKISGRPNWARDTLPNNTDRGRSSPMKSQPPTDQYQQMLDEKRREEASRRRYDDPEYQGRLAESRERERGEAGPRYGGY